jgi:subfamily B ATP-binding cassette protein MsbA
MTRFKPLLKRHWRRMWHSGEVIPYLLRYKSLLLFASVFLILAAIIEIIFPLVSLELFNRIRTDQFELFSPVVLAIAALYLLGTVATFVSQLVIAYVGERAALDLRTDVYRHLHALSVRFFIKHQTGELLSRLSSDISRLQLSVGGVFSGIITNTLTIVGVCVIMVTLNTNLALVLPLFLIPFVILGAFLGVMFQYLARRIQDHLALAFSLAEDALHGIRTVKTHNRESHEIARFESSLHSALKNGMQLVYGQSSAGAILALLGRLAATGILVMVAQAVLKQNLSLEEIITFLFYGAILWGALSNWLWAYLNVQNVGGATERIFAILAEKPDIRDMDGAISLPPLAGHIHFENVSFAYDQPILQNFDLEIQPGETVALVGASGVGKTTILNLLCRFLDPDAGRILLDGHDIRSVTQASLRANLGIVFQEPFIFATSIEENIRYGNLDASEDDLMWAARSAEVDPFVSQMPDGYATLVGESGLRLSGGQRQRIALARLLISRPKIILLDEVTSSLDGETERIVTSALNTIFKDHTVLLASHRPSMARQAHRIIVLHDGGVAEMGSHTELLQQNGIYARLFGII